MLKKYHKSILLFAVVLFVAAGYSVSVFSGERSLLEKPKITVYHNPS